MGTRLIGRMLLLFFIPALGGPVARGGEESRYEFTEKHMGTEFRVVFYAPDKPTAVAAVTAVFKRVRELEQVMSDYRPTSEVMKLCLANDAEPGKDRPVSADLARVLGHSLDTWKLSDGAFDVTVGPLSQLWRTARKTGRLPDTEALRSARAKVGSEQIVLDREAKTVRLTAAGVRIDFGGIGKGFAADECLSVFKTLGISRALVAAAGDITVGDPPPDRDAWVVDIAGIGSTRPKRTINLVNASVSTSGDLEQAVEIDGVRYSHVVNPKTGLGLTGRRSVTVIAPKGYQADSLTKLASVLPAAEAIRRLETVPGTAVFIAVQETEESPVMQSESPSFRRYVVPPK